MGMFDQPKLFEDHFREGEPFTLEDMQEGLEINTKHGRGTPTLLLIGGELYSVFGEGIANQLARMENGDLPAEVKLVRRPTNTQGQEVKVLVPASEPDPESA